MIIKNEMCDWSSTWCWVPVSFHSPNITHEWSNRRAKMTLVHYIESTLRIIFDGKFSAKKRKENKSESYAYLFASTALTSSQWRMSVFQRASNYYTLKIKFKWLSSFSVLFFLRSRSKIIWHFRSWKSKWCA